MTPSATWQTSAACSGVRDTDADQDRQIGVPPHRSTHRGVAAERVGRSPVTPMRATA